VAGPPQRLARDRGLLRAGRFARGGGEQAGDVAGEQVDLEVERVADGALTQRGRRERVRDQADGEAARVDGVDGEANPVDAHAALDRDVAEELGRRVEPHLERVAASGPAAHAREAVDVARNEVTAEGVAEAQGRLEVDAA